MRLRRVQEHDRLVLPRAENPHLPALHKVASADRIPLGHGGSREDGPPLLQGTFREARSRPGDTGRKGRPEIRPAHRGDDTDVREREGERRGAGPHGKEHTDAAQPRPHFRPRAGDEIGTWRRAARGRSCMGNGEGCRPRARNRALLVGIRKPNKKDAQVVHMGDGESAPGHEKAPPKRRRNRQDDFRGDEEGQEELFEQGQVRPAGGHREDRHHGSRRRDGNEGAQIK